MENPDLVILCAKWQKLLKLQDWEVKVWFARHFDLPDGKGAHISFSRPHKTATIRILDQVDYDPAANWPEDAESSLVHELIHLHFSLFDEEFGSTMVKFEEIAINALESAFIRLDRRVSCVACGSTSHVTSFCPINNAAMTSSNS